MPFSIPRFWHYRDSESAFSAMAADNGAPITLTGLGTAIQLNASAVTANYFDLLGVRPVRGRLFHQEEESSAAVVLVSDSFWRGRLGDDPNVLGRSVWATRYEVMRTHENTESVTVKCYSEIGPSRR